MDVIKQRAKELLELVEEEQNAQINRWDEKESNLKDLRASGELMFPLKLHKQSFSLDNSPLLFINYVNEYNSRIFDRGTSILVFDEEQNRCKGVIVECDGQQLTIQLYSEEIPDWINENQIGIIPHADEKTFNYMKGILKSVISENTNHLEKHLQSIQKVAQENQNNEKGAALTFYNQDLNESQKRAVTKSLGKNEIITIQGPPGTGKTTTLVEIIKHLKATNQKVIASAPSNTAVDHLALKLIQANVKILRLGNTIKVNDEISEYTPNGILAQPENQKQIKKLRIAANELRKKASQFKRNFTKEDRENRKQWRAEAKSINKEIRALSSYIISKHVEQADVILGTPVGLCDSYVKETSFDVGIIDEAGQSLIPMGYLVMDNAERVVLCGDQQQLPPTVISERAKHGGFNVSILEEAIQQSEPSVMLDLQYRMPPLISDFSSAIFYANKLLVAKDNTSEHLLYYDTSGAGYKEVKDENGSISNPEELEIVEKILNTFAIQNATFISPYSSQVQKAKSSLPSSVRCSTIDSFQGQEDDIVIISLVRNNEEGEIGFLSDYRRMNVALTRARNKLIVIGDSATLGSDEFYTSFIAYTEDRGAYKSVFELMY